MCAPSSSAVQAGGIHGDATTLAVPDAGREHAERVLALRAADVALRELVEPGAPVARGGLTCLLRGDARDVERELASRDDLGDDRLAVQDPRALVGALDVQRRVERDRARRLTAAGPSSSWANTPAQ